MLYVAAAWAQNSPETTRWSADARRQITTSWSACVDNLSARVPLPEASYTTVAEAEVGADGAPVALRIVKASGSSALDECAVRAFRASGRFPVPPPSMTAAGGTAHISEIVLTLRLASAPAPAPVKGPVTEAVRIPGVSAAAVATAATRVATAEGGTRNVWCLGGDTPRCDIRDARGSMLVFTVTVCRSGPDLTLGTAYGPMRVAGGAELVPAVAECR